MRSGGVVIVSDYAGGEGAGSGGAGHAAYDSYRALRDAGVDVRLIVGYGAASGDDRVTSLGGTDLREGGIGGIVRAVYNPAARRALADALAGDDPDTTIVILHQWTRYLSPAALGVLNRFRTMIYMHDYFWACPTGAYYDFVAAAPCTRRPMGVRCVTANCDRGGRVHKSGRLIRQAARDVLVRGPPARRLFLHLSPGALRTAAPLLPGEHHAILHNPLDVPDAPPPPPEPRYDIGYFGRMEPEKGLLPLIDAAARLRLSGLFVGDGAIAPELARHPLLEHRRWAPRGEMHAAMRACAVVVLPSLWHETWGLIVPEAMAAGAKVLVSARAGSAELVRRFGGGATFDPGVPGDLDRALGMLLDAPAMPLADWRGLRTLLSPERHAARIVALAAHRFGIVLRAPVDAAVIPPAARRAPLPAPLPPPPR